MFDYLIPITQDHIDEGRCGDEYNCALARALDTVFLSTFSFVNHAYFTVWVSGYGRVCYISTSRLERWISTFDEDKSRVSPIVVKLMRAPDGSFWADILEQEEES